MSIGVWHNGTSNIEPKETESGLWIPDASLAEQFEDKERAVRDQIRHALLAEERGFDRITFTEHRCMITGAEFSPNPLMTQMAIAARTEGIRLRQMANIVTWHDPVRFAEQVALLDVVSDGRVECGVGRGYQNREAELMGQYWGGGVQDQEMNRKCFEEKIDIIRSAWTNRLFSYDGEFHQIPPSWTLHHHPQEKAYLEDGVTEYGVEDMIEWVEADGRVMLEEGESTLKSIAVFPHPVQEPHPPLWQPVTSSRSIRFAAENGFNAYGTGSQPPSALKETHDRYYDALEEAGWPDARPEYDGEPFQRGWDPERQRGWGMRIPVHNTEVSDEETYRRYEKGVACQAQYTGWFGPFEAYAKDGGNPADVPYEMTPEEFVEARGQIVGDTEEIIDRIAELYEVFDVPALNLDIEFEGNALTGAEADAQLEAFAEDVLPYLREEFDAS